MEQELKEGLYTLPYSKKWVIKVGTEKWLFVGSETDCRLMMNDLAEHYNEKRNCTGTMKEIKSLNTY